MQATASLYADKEFSMTGNGPKTLYTLTTAWQESTATWSIPWEQKGGDFSPTPIATNDNDTVGNWEDYDVTPVIKGIVEDDDPNYGFILLFDDYIDGYGVYYTSSEAEDPSLRPKLTVTYFLDDTEPPSVSVTSPKAGDVWEKKSTHIIRWDATDNNLIASSAVYFSPDNGTTWSLVDSVPGKKKYYSWQLPDTVSEECKIKVDTWDPDGNVGSGESDLFTIETITAGSPVAAHTTKTILLKKMAGTWRLYLPLFQKGAVTVADSRGRMLYSFNAAAGKQWHVLSGRMSVGVYFLTVKTAHEIFVKKCTVVQ